ncbi:peptidase [Kribbella pittospori]|uniref:Peptidase n=1 Tax=Kribbella pittospori TaxID=722689 RepID=A0A4R0KWL3_9ACTN|nr:M64 family metallopeptidase [Kribbella pittospori]TCC65431.1 peptidase [Kribbella pittospori]
MRTRRFVAVLGVVAAVFAGLPTAAGASTTEASATVVPIQVTGPAASRFNLVVMGDGYTAAELPKFREQVDKHLNILWSIEPFKSYRDYFNVYAVEITSPESGVDCDPDLTSPQVDTPLQMGFWGGCNPGSVQRLLTVDTAAATQYANLVPGTTSANRQILAIGNSDTYGGAGGSYATASGGNALSALITPHELGHSLGGLQDEYDYYARGDRGAPYEGPEPSSIHHTLLTEQQMRDQQKKWYRWLGEPSESGGTIGRYEGGMYAGSGVWRPSRHSMMKALGYYFDQVARERMTQRISSRTNLFQDSTPVGQVAGDQVVWLQTLHPLSHELDVTWTLDGTALPTATTRAIDLAALDLTPGQHTLTAKVVDPTEFIRDPAARPTASRSWTVDTSLTAQPSTAPVTFTGSTSTEHPVSADEVVYAETTQSSTEQPSITWRLDGAPVANPGNDRDFDLEPLHLIGKHTLTASVAGETLTWSVDGVEPVVKSTLSKPLLTVQKPTGPEYIYNDAFTMGLAATDDSAGYVVPEFRVDGDGWYNYFGWPTDASAPFRFTAEGTEIDQLVYGKLGVPRVVPWDDVPPGYGRHQVEYRAIDATGNIGTPRRFAVTLLRPAPACTSTVTGVHSGPLVVRSGVTCLVDATVNGPLLVQSGASLVATGTRIVGPVRADRAADLQLLRSTVAGPVTADGVTRSVVAVGSSVNGPVSVTRGRTTEAAVLAGNTVDGPLSCSGNAPAPVNLQAPNQVSGPRSGQCAGL